MQGSASITRALLAWTIIPGFMLCSRWGRNVTRVTSEKTADGDYDYESYFINFRLLNPWDHNPIDLLCRTNNNLPIEYSVSIIRYSEYARIINIYLIFLFKMLRNRGRFAFKLTRNCKRSVVQYRWWMCGRYLSEDQNARVCLAYFRPSPFASLRWRESCDAIPLVQTISAEVWCRRSTHATNRTQPDYSPQSFLQQPV